MTDLKNPPRLRSGEHLTKYGVANITGLNPKVVTRKTKKGEIPCAGMVGNRYAYNENTIRNWWWQEKQKHMERAACELIAV